MHKLIRQRREAALKRHVKDGVPVRVVSQAVIDVLDAMERMTGERDAMVARWPDDRNGAGPVLYHHADGTWWLETLHGNRWPRNHGPHPTREAAVRAAAGITTTQQESKP